MSLAMNWIKFFVSMATGVLVRDFVRMSDVFLYIWHVPFR